MLNAIPRTKRPQKTAAIRLGCFSVASTRVGPGMLAASNSAMIGALISNHQATMRTEPQAIGRKQKTRQTSRTRGRLPGNANNSTTASTEITHILPINKLIPGGTHSSILREEARDDVRATYS